MHTDERSWQAHYDFDSAGVGVPGLAAMARYVHGDNFKYQGCDLHGAERHLQERQLQAAQCGAGEGCDRTAG